VLSLVFFVLSMVFVWRSFYGMRIRSGAPAPTGDHARAGAAVGGR
jgi:K(+)-stimulated pyrophosphate-energized sodium pump